MPILFLNVSLLSNCVAKSLIFATEPLGPVAPVGPVEPTKLPSSLNIFNKLVLSLWLLKIEDKFNIDSPLGPLSPSFPSFPSFPGKP